MATYAGAEDLISVGAYVKGSNAEIDEAIEKLPAIEEFLIQRIEEKAPLAETLQRRGDRGIEIPEGELKARSPRVRDRGAGGEENARSTAPGSECAGAARRKGMTAVPVQA